MRRVAVLAPAADVGGYLRARALPSASHAPERATVATFAGAVAERLAMGERLYGDTSFHRPLARLLAEIAEECEDIGAWSQIAAAVLAERTDLTPSQRSTIARAIKAAQAQGRWAWERLHGALRTIEEKEAESG